MAGLGGLYSGDDLMGIVDHSMSNMVDPKEPSLHVITPVGAWFTMKDRLNLK
jgi:hypothetical protein